MYSRYRAQRTSLREAEERERSNIKDGSGSNTPRGSTDKASRASTETDIILNGSRSTSPKSLDNTGISRTITPQDINQKGSRASSRNEKGGDGSRPSSSGDLAKGSQPSSPDIKQDSRSSTPKLPLQAESRSSSRAASAAERLGSATPKSGEDGTIERTPSQADNGGNEPEQRVSSPNDTRTTPNSNSAGDEAISEIQNTSDGRIQSPKAQSPDEAAVSKNNTGSRVTTPERSPSVTGSKSGQNDAEAGTGITEVKDDNIAGSADNEDVAGVRISQLGGGPAEDEEGQYEEEKEPIDDKKDGSREQTPTQTTELVAEADTEQPQGAGQIEPTTEETNQLDEEEDTRPGTGIQEVKEDTKLESATSPRPAEVRTKWEEVVGLDGEEAKAKILAERPELQVEILKDGTRTTRDYRETRVRIFVNDDGKVSTAPFCA